MAETLVLKSCIWGFHVYNLVWTSSLDHPEVLICRREPGNVSDPYAVVVCNSGGTAVGHIPRKISAMCSLFLLRGGTMICEVSGPPRYSADLPQGGLEHPCRITFVGPSQKLCKIAKLFEEVPICAQSDINEAHKPEAKKPKTIVIDSSSLDNENACQSWIERHGYQLSLLDKEALYNGEMLNDLHINISQAILKNQFPEEDGLICTLLQAKKTIKLQIRCGLQIVHCKGNHWILASNMNCEEGTLQVFDSLYASVDEGTFSILKGLFWFTKLKMMPFQKQKGASDCGLFSIATATAILFGQDPAWSSFEQHKMRNHLLNCIECGSFTTFPNEH